MAISTKVYKGAKSAVGAHTKFIRLTMIHMYVKIAIPLILVIPTQFESNLLL